MSSSSRKPRRGAQRSDREDPFAQLPEGEPEAFPGDVSEEIFWNVADSFIETANNHGDAVPVETVSAAIMYASSRYNAFLAVTQHADSTSDDQAAELDVDATLDYFTLQYRKMLEDSLAQFLDTPEADPERVDDDR